MVVMTEEGTGLLPGALIYVAALHGFTQMALSPNALIGFAWTAVGFGLAIVVLYAALTGFWRRWVFWLPRPERGLLEELSQILVCWLVLTVTFAAATATLYRSGNLALEAGVPASDSLLEIEKVYVWHLLDAIPILDVPETINWELRSDLTDMAGGFLILAYKLLVILPVVSGVVDAVRRVREARLGAGAG